MTSSCFIEDRILSLIQEVSMGYLVKKSRPPQAKSLSDVSK